MSNFDKCQDVKYMIVTFGSGFVNKFTWTFYDLTSLYCPLQVM